MEIDPSQQSLKETYQWMVRLITPRPIAWVSTISREGIPNLAPYSFFNGIGAHPPTLMFAPVNRRDGTRKDSLVNIEATGQFVVNVVSSAQAAAMNQTSAEYDADVNEFEACKIAQVPSQRVQPPRVADAPAAFECELLQTLHLGTGPAGANVVIGRIVLMHVAESVLTPQGEFDPDRWDAIGRLGGNRYTRLTDSFELPRPQPPHSSQE